MMKPILFNTDMVRAILDGRKTVTRRVVKQQLPDNFVPCPIQDGWSTIWVDGVGGVKVPYHPGDILYVRETWGTAFNTTGRTVGKFVYLADGDPLAPMLSGKWSPSIHMPRRAARLFLRVTGVRVERLQDITEDGVIDEGAEPLLGCDREHRVYDPELGDEPCWNHDPCKNCPCFKSYQELFGEYIWDSTIKPKDRDLYGWAANPWVWVIEFEKTSLDVNEGGEDHAGDPAGRPA